MKMNLEWPGLTFEEDKLAVAVLVDGVYLGRQAPPENADEHGVPRHHRVVSHSPKPVILVEKHERTLLGRTDMLKINHKWDS